MAAMSPLHRRYSAGGHTIGCALELDSCGSECAVRGVERGGMRPDRLRLRVVAAWLGVVALGLNALVPVHLAFDLAHAAAGRHQHSDVPRDFLSALLTLVTGHHDAAGGESSDKDRHHDECAVCGAVATLSGFALAAVVLLSAPVFAGRQILRRDGAQAPSKSPVAAYRSRAPPLV